MISSGTGRPIIQPATRIFLRPIRSLSPPANRFASAFVTPNVTMNERTAVREVRPKSCSASRGRTARSRPTMPPTNALMTTSSTNCRQLALRPRAIRSATWLTSALVRVGSGYLAPPRRLRRATRRCPRRSGRGSHTRGAPALTDRSRLAARARNGWPAAGRAVSAIPRDGSAPASTSSACGT